jgi:diphthamide biosynthesis protein 2
LTAIAELRSLIARSGRKSYTIVAGKPNPQKLANFPEIQSFVLVSCEHAALIDGRDYLQPVITPWEARVAFTRGSHWDGEVRLDFEHLLEPARERKPREGSSREDEREGADDEPSFSVLPEFSFLSGGVRASPLGSARNSGAEAEDEDVSESEEGVLGDGIDRSEVAMRLAVRANAAVAARKTGGRVSEVLSGAEYLLGRRSYVGLEPGPRRGEDGAAADAPLIAAQGLSGRARSYANEKERVSETTGVNRNID